MYMSEFHLLKKVRASVGSTLLTDGRRRTESNVAFLLPLDGDDCIMERFASVFDDIKRMRVDELSWLMINGGCPIVHLQVDWPEVAVHIVLMPPHEQTPRWFDPVDSNTRTGHSFAAES